MDGSERRLHGREGDSLGKHDVADFLVLVVVFEVQLVAGVVFGEPSDGSVEVVVEDSILNQAFLGVVLLLEEDCAEYLSGRDAHAEVFKEEI